MVERALAGMEGSSDLGRRVGASAPTSPILGSALSPNQHEVLQKLFKSLLNDKDRAASHGVSPGAGTIAAATTGTEASGKTPATGPRTSSGGRGSQKDPDAGSGKEGG